MERNTNKILLTVIGISVLIVATVGATFAYFSATGGTQEEQITTGELKVAATSSLEDGAKIKPTKWTNATDANGDADIAKVGLSVATNGTTIENAKYDILLSTEGVQLNATRTNADDEVVTLEGGELSDVKWALYDNTDLTTALATGDFGVDEEGVTDGDVTNLAIKTGVVITPNNTVADAYTLYIWIENTENAKQDQLQGLTIGATLDVNARQ
ncbi:MAG: hypothetical protein E7166_00245 [Firmicutes bacterium]|nr:hypothetical protein [Bacillota bacterium]